MVSCASKPDPAAPASVKPVTAEPGPAAPQGPGQALLDELNAARSRAQSGREKALAVQAQAYFPDQWNKAESDNNAGKNAKIDTEDEIRQGIALFNAAASGYEAIAVNAGPLFAKDQENANSALQAAIARAEKSRKDAQDNQGPKYFPDDWTKAEAERQNGLNAKKDTIEEMKSAAAIFNSAADSYDAIAGKSQQILAKEKEDANKTPQMAKEREDADKALQAAMARAEKSRQDAMNVKGQTYFPNDWRNAEAKNTSAKNAKITTTDEIKAATALFASAADAYDDIAKKSQQMIAKEKEDANKALQAAMARAEKSRQNAVNASGQTYFPNDWRNAETKNTSAKNAKTTTTDEIKAATALFSSAADAYDDIAKKSQQTIAKEKEDADKALQAAIARMEKSRKQAQDAKADVNLPNDWNNAEAKNKTASGAKRSTAAEIKAAVPLYNSAADAYDDLVKKNVAFLNDQNQKLSDDARARAGQERQKALDVKANIAAASEFDGADMLFKQADKDFNEKNFTSAVELYNKSADQFIAAVLLTEKKRALADETIGEAKNKSSQSAGFAVNAGLPDNQYMLENTRLIGLAENAYADAKYDDAVKYAQEAMKNARMSDEHVALQMKRKGALDAIEAAQARLDQIKKMNAHVKHAAVYEKAELTFTEAMDYHSMEEWDKAKESALAVIAILSEIPSVPVLAAQYLVKTWNGERDCLWNIAGRKEIYGDPWKWRVIYNANRHKLPNPNNPNVVEPGTLLDIPSIAGEYRAGILED
jgi:predicted nucleic acid-binding Zn ribbon protein